RAKGAVHPSNSALPRFLKCAGVQCLKNEKMPDSKGLVEVIWLAALEREDAEFAPGQVADGGEGRNPDDRPAIVAAIQRRLGVERERVSRVAQERAVFLQGVRDHFFPAWPGLRVDRE